MKKKHLLSVIVANRNYGQFLAQCLDSILNQTYPELEIVVSDDGSTDNSPGIIKKYVTLNPGKIRGIFNKETRGPAHARHQAIMQARGKFITTLDSDDFFYDPDKLTREMDLIERYEEIEKQEMLPFSNIVMVNREGNYNCCRDEYESVKQGKIFPEILGRSCMIPLNFIIKKAAYFEVGGYDLSLRTHEDWDLKLKLAEKYPYIYTRTWGAAYRIKPGSLSTGSYRQTTNNLWKVFSRHIKSKSLTQEQEKKAREEFLAALKKRDKKFIKRFNNPGPLRVFYYRILGRFIKAKWNRPR